jgi:hypothetical protein
MKRVILSVFLLASIALAQTGTMIQVTFTPSASATAVKHEIWGAAVACPPSGIPSGATLMATVLVSASPNNSWDFTSGVTGTTYCFYALAKDSAGNASVASNTTQAVFPFPQVAPPTNVQATAK